EMIRPALELTTQALRRAIASAGLVPDDLASVLLAGGSSRIPLVFETVSEAFGRPVRMSLHPNLTVASGAAAIAAERLPGKAPGAGRTGTGAAGGGRGGTIQVGAPGAGSRGGRDGGDRRGGRGGDRTQPGSPCRSGGHPGMERQGPRCPRRVTRGPGNRRRAV